MAHVNNNAPVEVCDFNNECEVRRDSIFLIYHTKMRRVHKWRGITINAIIGKKHGITHIASAAKLSNKTN
jgi:hypothetical protein